MISSFLTAFAIYRVADLLWLWRIRREYPVSTSDLRFVDTWIRCDLGEFIACIVLVSVASLTSIASLPIMLAFAAFRLMSRFLASLRYRRVYFV